MGADRATRQALPGRNHLALARELRRNCNGKFGNMSASRWNDRIIGTRGLPRYSNDKDKED